MVAGDFARLLLTLIEIIAVAQLLGFGCRRFGQPSVPAAPRSRRSNA